MAAAWAIAIAAAALGADVRVDGGVRVEGRSRTVDAPGAERITSVEVAARPQVSLAVVGPDLELGTRYAPVVRSADVLVSSHADVLHTAELRARYRLVPTWVLGAAAGGERGTTDLLAENRLRGVAPEAVPTTSELRFVSARADLALEGRIDPRTSVGLGAGWFAGGGDDAESRALLPFQRGVRANARAEWNATPLDVLALQGTGLGARLSDGREGGAVTLLAGWRHRIERDLEARAGAGAAATRESGPAQPRRTGLLPAGELGLAHASERLHLAEEALVRAGTSVDRLRGSVDRAFEAEVSTRWAPNTALTFAARATAAFVVHETGDGRRGAVDVRVERRLSPYLSLGLGAYASWQRSADPALPGFVEAGASATFAVDLAPRGAERL